MLARVTLRIAPATVLPAILLLAIAALGTAGRAMAADLALVLLTDVSGSMDEDEYALVKNGYRTAFRDPDVVAAIEASPGGVVVSYVEFSGAADIATVTGWRLVTDAASAGAFGDTLAAAPRSSNGNTALAAGLRQAAAMLADGGFGRARRVIDVVSDHPSDGGRSRGVRDAAVAAGITINALPIGESGPVGRFNSHLTYVGAAWGAGGMDAFYQRDIIGGPGSFMIKARDYGAFSEALKRKLLRELLSGAPSGIGAAAGCCPGARG